MREFETGATRDTDEGKFDYEGFLSPAVLEAYAEYMHTHRKQADGKLRDSDNWQRGIPLTAYMKSMWRHFMDLWKAHRGLPAPSKKESLCALLFNVQGYLLEELKKEGVEPKIQVEKYKAYQPIYPTDIQWPTSVTQELNGDLKP